MCVKPVETGHLDWRYHEVLGLRISSAAEKLPLEFIALVNITKLKHFTAFYSGKQWGEFKNVNF